VHFDPPERLDHWCAERGHREAIVGGFYLRAPFRPLGELWLGGRAVVHHEPVAEPYERTRACVHVDGEVRLRPRGELPDRPVGDLVHAGPLLVRDGRSVIDGTDPEGFSAGAAQFDSDITAERHPRAALGVADDHLIAVCCDGRRTGLDAGLDLSELADLLLAAGARDAINLDGGGSTTLVHRGHLLNRPYSNVDQPAPESRPIVTALLF
jgi:exopolysaccharide biosynthesis protein